jgi:hypothetical protein
MVMVLRLAYDGDDISVSSVSLRQMTPYSIVTTRPRNSHLYIQEYCYRFDILFALMHQTTTLLSHTHTHTHTHTRTHKHNSITKKPSS